MSRPTETCPSEIWHEIFAFACTDTGLTGRSLSLVSKQFHDISEPLKYQSIAITGRRQLFAFSQTYPQLPDLQRRIKYLFIHCSYGIPFLDVKDDPPSEADSDEELRVLQDLSNGFLAPENNFGLLEDCWHKIQNIQAFFDKTIHVLHAILNEASSTLNILTLDWMSFEPLQIHAILSGVVLPFLDELHLCRYSVVATYLHADSKTTALLPRLRYLILSGDGRNSHKCVDRDIAIIAPNLTHLRFTQFDNISPKFHKDVIADMSIKETSDQIQAMVNGRSFDKSTFSLPVMKSIGTLPREWQSLWSSRVAGLPDVWSVLWPDSSSWAF